VPGLALSTDFPTTPGAIDRSYNGDGDAFVLRLDPPAYSLGYGTLLAAMAGTRPLPWPGRRDNIYLAGWTWSTDFPTRPELLTAPQRQL